MLGSMKFVRASKGLVIELRKILDIAKKYRPWRLLTS